MFDQVIDIHGVPNLDGGTFDTQATMTIGWLQPGGPYELGFKMHVPRIDYNGSDVVFKAINNNGWSPVMYQHVLFDEAFVSIRHKNGAHMLIDFPILRNPQLRDEIRS